MRTTAGLLALCTLLRGGEAAVTADEIKALPGWTGALPTKHYSGYLDASKGTKHMHYYLQLSENDPKTDPVTLWMNGERDSPGRPLEPCLGGWVAPNRPSHDRASLPLSVPRVRRPGLHLPQGRLRGAGAAGFQPSLLHREHNPGPQDVLQPGWLDAQVHHAVFRVPPGSWLFLLR